MSQVSCSKCNRNKQRNAFSNNQLRKAKHKRRCKKCISHDQKQNHPRASANDKFNSESYIKSIQEEAAKLDEPGQLSLLQKLHQHCFGKTVFTEIHLALNINNPAEMQVGLQRIFGRYPDTFAYQTTIIIASNNEPTQSSIYLGIKKHVPIPLIDQTTKLCVPELLYKIGKISKKGVEFNHPNNTINNCDISDLLCHPIVNYSIYAAKEHEEVKEQSQSFIKLQQKQKTIKLTINKLKRELDFLENKMKAIKDRNVLVSWNSIKAVYLKKPDHIFIQDNLKIFKDLLTTVLEPECIEIQESEGQFGDVSLRINNKIVSISRNLTNQDFMSELENIMKQFAQQTKNPVDVSVNNDDNIPGVSEIQNDNKNEDAKNDDEKHGGDGMLKLIESIEANVMNHQKMMKYEQTLFERMTKQLNQMVQNNVLQMEKGLQSQNVDLFNLDMAPIKLVLAVNDKHEPNFLSYVMGKKQIIMMWISQKLSKYEGICEYGAEHIFFRFINWIQLSKIGWWIAVLRWLLLPVSITNLNLLMQYTKKSVNEHFLSAHSIFGTEIDIIMVVTYFMNIRPKEYQSNALKFIHDRQNIKLNIEDAWENERKIIKLCESCFRHVVDLIPQYKKSSNAQTMSRQIDRYMSRNRTENLKARRDLKDKNQIIYSKSNT